MSDAPRPALGELARLAKAATPGPWHAATKMHPEAVRLRKEAASVYGPDCLIYTSSRDYDCLPETWAQQQANAEFIAACSPELILQLVALASGGATGGQEQKQDLDKTAKGQTQEPKLVGTPRCAACGHRHFARCRHRLNPHFYEHRADAPLCGCTAAARSLTPERPADAD